MRRLERNPLRIFDCKNPHCIEISEHSPLLFDHLCNGCREHFNMLLEYLKGFQVKIAVNKKLVRGLDYYTKTVFEVTSQELGAQKAFIAGGRYDNLIEEMGGPKIPGSGFAIGVERLALITSPEPLQVRPTFFLANLGEKARSFIIPLLRIFVQKSLSLSYSYEEKSLKAQMRYADSLNMDYVLILGDDEIEKGIIIVRNMKSKEQHELPLELSKLMEKIEALILN
jgi:histidyl-tRNA synthetase